MFRALTHFIKVSSASARSARRVAYWSLFEQAIRLGGSLLVTASLARQLGVTAWGELAGATAAVGFLQVVLGLGLESTLLGKVHRNDRAELYLIAGVVLQIIVSAVILGALLLAAYRWPEFALVAYSGCLLPAMSGGLLRIDFLAKEKAYTHYKLKSISVVVATGIRLAMISMNVSIEFHAIVTLIELVVYTVLVSPRFCAIVLGKELQEVLGALLGLFRTTLPAAVTSVSVAAQAYLDQWLVSFYLTGETAGNYNAAARYVGLWAFVPLAYCSFISQKRANEVRAAYEAQALSMATLLGIGLSLACALGASVAIKIIYGNDYSESIFIALTMASKLFFITHGCVRSTLLDMKGKLVWRMSTELLGLIIACLICTIFLPKIGIWAILIAYYGSQTIVVFIMDWLSSSTRQMAHQRIKSLYRLSHSY